MPKLHAHQRGTRRPAVVVGLLGAAFLGCPGVAHAAPSWSQAISVDPHHRRLPSVSCPTTTQCTAVDTLGYESTFDPNPGGPSPTSFLIDTGDPLQGAQCPSGGPDECTLDAVACPSAIECIAVDLNSLEMTFNPSSPTMANSGEIDEGGHGSANTLNGLGCPIKTQCTTVDNVGAQLTFNPADPDNATGLQIDPSDSLYGLTSVACPSKTQCTAVDNTGHEVTFNPRSTRYPRTVTIDPRGWLTAVACASKTQCTAVDRHGREITFNPLSPRPHSALIDNAALNGIACPSRSLCVVADREGRVVVGDPGGHWELTRLSSTRLQAVDCISTSRCVVVDSAGQAFVGR
jgi:hypothetical protein